jgi:hypothetical protein
MHTIVYIYDILLILIILIGVFHYKVLTIPFKILTIGMIATFIIAILSKISIIRYKTNAPILHLEAIIEFVFYALTYYYLFTTKIIKKIIIICIISFTIFSVINGIFLQPFRSEFPTNVNLPTLALLVVFSLLLFKQMLLYPLKIPILKQGIFWFNTAIFFYATTLFLNIGLSNLYTSNPALNTMVFYLWYFVLYIFNVLIGISLLRDSKEINKTDAL